MIVILFSAKWSQVNEFRQGCESKSEICRDHYKILGASVDIENLPQRLDIEHLSGMNIFKLIIKFANQVKSNHLNDCPKFTPFS